MNRLKNKFDELKQKNQKALVGYLTAGDPDIETSKKILLAACKNGLDILEMGIAFSDPVSDGPTIQKAAQRAIAAGVNLEKSFSILHYLRQQGIDIPIIIFSYYNPILAMGAENFVQRAKTAGADGVLIVDLPFEHSSEMQQYLDDSLTLIPLIAPTTGPQRLQAICHNAQGFIYLISRVGVTGTGEFDIKPVIEHTAEVRKFAKVPICVGFGVSNAEDVRNLTSVVDGIVVGSAMVKIIEENAHNANIDQLVAEKIRQLKAATIC